MVYKHRVTQALADFINRYGGGGKDTFMRAVWYGIKGQVPLILQALDSNEEAIAEIEKQLRKALGIELEPMVTEERKGIKEELVGYFRRRSRKDGSISIRIPADSKLSALFPIEAAEVEAIIEPEEGKSRV